MVKKSMGNIPGSPLTPVTPTSPISDPEHKTKKNSIFGSSKPPNDEINDSLDTIPSNIIPVIKKEPTQSSKTFEEIPVLEEEPKSHNPSIFKSSKSPNNDEVDESLKRIPKGSTNPTEITIDVTSKSLKNLQTKPSFFGSPLPDNVEITASLNSVLSFALKNELVKFSSPSLKKIKEEKPELFEVLSSKSGRHYFRLYSKSEYSMENILFYEEVLKFKQIESKEELDKKAKQIYEKFIDEKSHTEVNINKKLSNEVKEIINKNACTVQMYDSILRHLLDTVIPDTFTRFQKSELYDEYISQKLSKEKTNRFYSRRISETELDECLNQIYSKETSNIVIDTVVHRIDSSSNYFEKSFQQQQETIDLIAKYEEKYKFEMEQVMKDIDKSDEVLTFRGVLSNVVGRFYLRKFSKIEHSIENFLFYEEVLLFKDIEGKEDLKAKVIEIYDAFLSENSLFQVNVTEQLSNEIDEKVKDESDIGVDVFDKIVTDLMFNVMGEVFKRFEKSSQFAEYKDLVKGNK